MKELMELIELLLEDGQIDENERALIFRRASELDISDSECSIILNSMINRHNKKKDSLTTTPKRVFEKKEIIKTEPVTFGLEAVYKKKIDDELKATETLYATIGNDSKELNHLVSEAKEEFAEVELLVEAENRRIEKERKKLNRIKAKLDDKLESYITSLEKTFKERSVFDVDFNKSDFYDNWSSLSFNDALYKSMKYEINEAALKRKINQQFLLGFVIGLPIIFIAFLLLDLLDSIIVGIILYSVLVPVLLYGNFKNSKHKEYSNQQYADKKAFRRFSELVKSNGFNNKEIEQFQSQKRQVSKLAKINIDDLKQEIQKGESFTELWMISEKILNTDNIEEKIRLNRYLYEMLSCETGSEYFLVTAKIWKELFGEAEKAKECLVNAESNAKQISDWGNLAKSWMELFGDTEKAKEVLVKAEGFTEKIRLENENETEIELLGGKAKAEKYFRQQNSFAKYIFLATSWKELFNETDRAKNLLEKAEGYTDSIFDERKLAKSWMKLFGDTEKAKKILQKPENTAKYTVEWCLLAESWKELFGDTEKAREFLHKAESVAKFSSHWEALAKSWKQLLGDVAKENECLEMASRCNF